VALESIEHVPDGAAFFAALCRSIKPSGRLVFSTPCEDLLPHSATGNHFHFKHYTLAETLALARSHGMSLVEFAGQDTYDMTPDGRQGPLLPEDRMQLKAGTPGQFIIALAEKAA
jgi:SAM-dependent methyltransferase